MGEVAERARVKLPWSYANSRPIKAHYFVIMYLLSFIRYSVRLCKGGTVMTDNISYQIDKAKISKDKMQFNVIHRRPKFTSKDKETVKAEIEKQLFAVFSKYCTT